jgi:hypothetical protein
LERVHAVISSARIAKGLEVFEAVVAPMAESESANQEERA